MARSNRNKGYYDGVTGMGGFGDDSSFSSNGDGTWTNTASGDRVSTSQMERAIEGSYDVRKREKNRRGRGGGGSDPYDDYLDALQEEEEAAARALQAQIESGVTQLAAQKGTLKNTFNQSASDAYVQNMLSKKNLPEQLAAQGITGGMAESSNVAMETAYGNAYNNLQGAYNQGLSDIDRDIAMMRANGDISIAQNAGQYAQTMAEAAYRQAQEQRAANAAKEQMLLQAKINREQAEYESQMQMQQQAATQQYKNSGGSTGSSGSKTQTKEADKLPNYQSTQSIMLQNMDYWKSLGYSDEKISEMLNKSMPTGRWY